MGSSVREQRAEDFCEKILIFEAKSEDSFNATEQESPTTPTNLKRKVIYIINPYISYNIPFCHAELVSASYKWYMLQ